MVQKYILLLDKNNFIGSSVSEWLQGRASVVLVTTEKVVGDGGAVVIPFTHPIPQIPEGDYVSISLVWEDGVSHLVEPLSRKALEQKIPFIIIFTHEQQEKVLGYKDVAHLFELGDLFGAPVIQPLDMFLQSVKAKRRAILSGMGLHLWRPVLFADAVKKIGELLLEHPQEKSIFVGPPHGVTALSLSHSLQKMDPDIVIDFSTEQKESVGDRVFGLSAMPRYDPVAALKNFYSSLRAGRGVGAGREEKMLLTREWGKKVERRSRLSYAFYVLLVLLLLPFLIAGGSGALGVLLLSSGIHDGERGSFARAGQEVAAAQINFATAKESVSLLSTIIPPLQGLGYFKDLQQQIVFGEQVSQITKDGLDAGQKLAIVLSGKTLAPQDDAEQAVGDLKHAQILLSSVRASDVPSQYRSLLGSSQKIGQLTSGLVEELPQILGTTGEKSYMILFLNNMELRPGGGFIGSYGLLHLRNGAVKDFTIHDVYDADGQLRGHVEPPFAIRRYVPIVHLYLRDSNFDPDFSNDAKIAASLLSQETGDRVDGVIGMDLNAFQNILSATGPLYVPSYNLTVNETNFFQMLESHVEKNFFPGSTQKKDFLRSIASSLMTKLQQGQIVSGQTLLSGVLSALSEKHVVMSFADPSLQEPFALSNLSGALPPIATASGGFNDFLGIVEANLGVNKANAYVGRQLNQKIDIADNGDLFSTVLLTLTNSSDGSWPGGPYKNYIRFMLPANAELTSVAFDDVEQHVVSAVTDPAKYEAKSFVAPKGLEVNKEEESGRVTYGFLVSVPTGKTMTIRVSYSIKKAIAQDQLSQAYNLLLWKQVGVASYPYTVSMTIPDAFRFVTPQVMGQTFISSGLLDGDKTVSLSFAKK